MRHFIGSAYRQRGLGCRRKVGVFNFDKDAFARAHFCCLHYCRPIAWFYKRQTARTTRIIEWLATLGYIRNAVFKLHKCVWAVIDTQPIAGA